MSCLLPSQITHHSPTSFDTSVKMILCNFFVGLFFVGLFLSVSMLVNAGPSHKDVNSEWELLNLTSASLDARGMLFHSIYPF